MPLPRSSATDVGRLAEELKSSDALRRETALARLAVIGARAVTPLMALAGDEHVPAASRVAALEALQATGDARPTPLAIALAKGADLPVALAAVAVLGPIARGKDGRATRALECLADLAVERAAPGEKRLAALDALDGLPAALIRPIWSALAEDPDLRIVARVTRKQSGVSLRLDELAGGALPPDPNVVAAIVREDAERTSVTLLRTLIDQIRSREKTAGEDDRQQWTAVRGQVHQSLAARGSRLALYDLRETFEASQAPLPVGFLAAMAAVGDVSCLEALAAAWIAAAPDDRWWRDHLSEVFRTIVTRERLTRRHPVMKKILDKRPAAGALVAFGRR